MSDYGSLQEVVVVPRGSSLTTAAAMSNTELVVDSAGDFDEEGGTLELNGVQLEYTGITWGVAEDDPDTITLALPLSSAADEDDAAAPVAGGQAVEDWYAVVDMGPGDSVHIPLTFAQRVLWPEGTYPDIPVIVSDNLQLIEDAPGRPAAVGGRTEAWNEDEWDAAGDDADSPGTLTYLPKANSLIVWNNGVRLRNNDFTLIDRLVTPLAAQTPIRSADKFSAYYLRDPAAEVVGIGVSNRYLPTVLADKPIAYYRIGEASGSTMVDSSGYSRDGVYTAVTLGTTGLITDDADTAGTFNGSSSQGIVPYGLWATSQILSIDAWIKPTSVTGGHVILARHDDPEASFIFRVKDGKLEFVGWTGPGGVGLAITQNSTTLVAGTRYHVGVRVASNSVNFFLEGVPDGTGALTGTVYIGTADLEVGVDGDGTEHFDGVLDEVALYDTYLSDARFAAHYLAGV